MEWLASSNKYTQLKTPYKGNGKEGKAIQKKAKITE